MSEFRELSLKELSLFEKEFKEFLAINGIDADLWQLIKKENPEKVDSILSSFSDVIYNSVLIKIEYLEYISTNDIKYFHYGKEKATLIGIESDSISLANVEKVIEEIKKGKATIRSYSISKEYSKKREVELFQMLKNGGQPSDGKIYKILKSMIF